MPGTSDLTFLRQSGCSAAAELVAPTLRRSDRAGRVGLGSVDCGREGIELRAEGVLTRAGATSDSGGVVTTVLDGDASSLAGVLSSCIELA